MRIINTIDKLKVKRQKVKLQAKSKNFYFCLSFLTFWFLLFTLHPGFAKELDLEQVENYVKESQDYYQKAVRQYKNLISQGKDLDNLYFSLGQLYFSHGDFQKAVEALKSSANPLAKKLQGISYYWLGNFVDALDVFSKNTTQDQEYLYYYGLTCEKLNLFDKALEQYDKIKQGEFYTKANECIGNIEKQAGRLRIKDIDPQVAKMLASSPTQEQYPQAGAFILYCDESIEVTGQNRQISSLHYLVKILNDRGKEDFSEIQIDYDSTYEKVELEYARTIKPDGTVTEIGTRHLRDVSKYLNFPLYSNARVFIISFPEITEGASIEYKVKIYSNQLINNKDFALGYPLQSSEPIIRANFSIALPADRDLHIKVLNEKYNNFQANLSPEILKTDSRIIYNWKFKDIPQIIPEPSMPPDVQINPTMLISTFSSWQEIYNWWWALAKEKIKADTDIKNKVKQLTKGLKSSQDRLRAIYNFCARQIRYVAVEYGQAGYEPHKAEDIFKNKYGDCKDQAILLVTMLKEAGFLAWPVLISTKEYYNLNPDFPSMLFNHCIAAVSFSGGIVFMDPTAQTCSFGDLPSGDQQRQVLIFLDSGCKIENTPLFPARHNLMQQELKMKINPDETIDAEKEIITQGVYDQAQRYWLLFSPPELIQQALQEKVQDVSIGAKLIKYKINNLESLNVPVALSYSFQGPEYFTVAGNLRILPQLASVDTSVVAKDKRKYDIDFDILDAKRIVFEMDLPRKFRVKYLPGDVNLDSPWMSFKTEYVYKNNRVVFTQNAELKKNQVSGSEYPDFKRFFEELAKKVKQRIVLERIDEK